MVDKEKAPELAGAGADEKVVTDNHTSYHHSRQTIYTCVNNSIGQWATEVRSVAVVGGSR